MPSSDAFTRIQHDYETRDMITFRAIPPPLMRHRYPRSRHPRFRFHGDAYQQERLWCHIAEDIERGIYDRYFVAVETIKRHGRCDHCNRRTLFEVPGCGIRDDERYGGRLGSRDCPGAEGVTRFVPAENGLWDVFRPRNDDRYHRYGSAARCDRCWKQRRAAAAHWENWKKSGQSFQGYADTHNL